MAMSGESTSSAPQVLIVGAGPTGLVLALVLRQNGVRVRIIEKDLAARVGQRGAGIMPRSLELFHLLGVGNEIEKQGIFSPRVRIYDMPEGIHPIQTFDMQPWNEPTPTCPYLNIQLLGQARLETILRAALADHGCIIEQSTELKTFEQAPGHVTAHLEKKAVDGTITKETTNFDYLIGTDGARGIVRKLLGLSFLGETRLVEHLVVGDVTIDGLNDEHWHMWGDASTTLVSLRPTEDPHSFNFMIAGAHVNHTSLAHDRDAVINFIYDHTGRMQEEGMNIREVTWLSHYKPNIRMVDTFGKDRVVIAGDSAHVHSPTGGQGMNTGIQDAFNLGWKLALVVKGHAPPSLLDSYTEERLPVIADMLDQTTVLLKKAFKGRNPDEEEQHWAEVVNVEQEQDSTAAEEQAQELDNVAANGKSVNLVAPGTTQTLPPPSLDAEYVDEDEEDDAERDDETSNGSDTEEPPDSDSDESDEDWDKTKTRRRLVHERADEPSARPGSLLQLGVNYRWSFIVLDEQATDAPMTPLSPSPTRMRAPTMQRHDSYGRKTDVRIRAGDRAPDAPALAGVRQGIEGDAPKALALRLFEVFGTSYHTIIVFARAGVDGHNLMRATSAFGTLSSLPKGAVRTAVVLPVGAPNPLPRVPGADYVLEDTLGYARSAYSLAGGCGIVVVRPDGVIGAVVRGAPGLRQYFEGVFGVDVAPTAEPRNVAR
ncbi:hypothetical protein HGRIS_004884 [Hohenbuehelia grisea]|uniref:FAD-binding domain-containing protein n=1 Tax=Hohenbuehelia grisea TaxID=104357 RepID=A0ABR3JDA1_9AGAR